MRRYHRDFERTLLELTELDKIVGGKALRELKELYNTDLRIYHNWEHALDVLMATMPLKIDNPMLRRAYSLAAVFHDAVYEVGNPLNESRSVMLMRGMVLGWEEEVNLASALIVLTAMHMTSTVEEVGPEVRDFLDCDLLSLSSTPWWLATYYDYAVCAEMLLAGQTEEEMYRHRVHFFKTMLAKPTVFVGTHYGTTREWQARQNMHRLLTHRHNFESLI